MSLTREELIAQLTPEQRATLPERYINWSRRALEEDMRETIQRWRDMAGFQVSRGNGTAAAQLWLDMAAVLERELTGAASGVVAEAEAVQ